MTNRNKLQKFFITYPQTDCTKALFRDALRPLYFTYLVIAQETHADGGKHLHAHLVLKDKMTRVQLMNHIGRSFLGDEKRIKYEATKNMSAPLYLFKEDPDPIIEGEPPK